jgi:hypothetical protein
MTTNPTLDRNRAFGQIHGEHELGGMFAQDGFIFDANDELIVAAMDAAQAKKLEERQAQDQAFTAARAAFKEIMPSASDEQIAKAINADNLKPTDPKDEPVDLYKWGMGQQEQILFSRVAVLIRETYNQSPTSKRQAREILAQHGIIPPVGGESTIPG